MRELQVANSLIENRAALAAAWDNNGYWFFRSVLDQHAVAELRSAFIDILIEHDVIAPEDPNVRYNGKRLNTLPTRMEPLVASQPWRSFVGNRNVSAFFRSLLADEPFWIPIAEYRATPPAADRSMDRIVSVHQDGFYNQGIPFKVCWIPLSEIDESVGGIMVAEGMHKGPILHDLSKPPKYPVPPTAVPESAWRRATYRPGDVLLFDLGLPHTGLRNWSDRFRLSMDVRVMGASGRVPLIGEVVRASADAIAIRTGDGHLDIVALNDETYLRDSGGGRLRRADCAAAFPPGSAVIVAFDHGHATVVRPVH
jgi:hypothetical protein